MEKWRLLSRQTVVSDRWLSVYRDECLTERNVFVDSYYVVDKADFAMAVALTPDLQLLLVRQYKHPTGSIVVECPAGYIADGEEPAAAVARELLEETGYRCDSIEPLGVWFGSPGVLTNRGHLFLGLNAVRVLQPELDQSEDIELVVVDLETALGDLHAGGLVGDLASTTGLLLAKERLIERGLLPRKNRGS